MKRIANILILMFVMFSFGNAKDTTYVINRAEVAQLNSLYDNCNGPNWDNKTGWPISKDTLKTKPIVYGLSFNDSIIQSSNATILIELSCKSINIQYDNLKGVLPNLYLQKIQTLELVGLKLTGNIPQLDMPELSTLNLSQNEFTGEFPIINTPKLQSLNIQDNQLSGSLPGLNFPLLNAVNIDFNNFSGPFPDLTLPRLKYLYANNNSFSGSLPNFNIPSIQYIALDNNQFSGDIPYFNMPKLTYLSLGNNKLTGKMPCLDLPVLKYLYISNNDLAGEIPALKTPQLHTLGLSTNHFKSIDTNLSHLNIAYLYLDSNKLTFNQLLVMQKPLNSTSSWFGHPSYHKQDTILPLHYDSLARTLSVIAEGKGNKYTWYMSSRIYDTTSGKTITIPIDNKPEYFSCVVTNPVLPKLELKTRTSKTKNIIYYINSEELYCLNKVYSQTKGATWLNHLGWPLPTDTLDYAPSAFGISFKINVLVKNDSLILHELSCDSINLEKNNLKGNLPDLNLPNCRYMNLAQNYIESGLPKLNMPKLYYLNIALNSLTGKVPAYILPVLEYLNLSQNKLDGSIEGLPYPMLTQINFTKNKLTGDLPSLSLANLDYLNISDNALNGKILGLDLPKVTYLNISNNLLNDTLPLASFPMLKHLDISFNNLSGRIPQFDMPNVEYVDLSHNSFSGAIPYIKSPNMRHLSLAANKLSATIPNFDHANIEYLNLSLNNLIGSIPDFELPNLQILYLNGNQLTGELPNFSLSNLDYLYVNNNKLSGTLPALKLDFIQFLDLSNNEFIGMFPNFDMPRLKRLKISSNRLSACADSFRLQSLLAFKVDTNRFTFKELEKLSGFKYLNNSFNYLGQDTTLPVYFNPSDRSLIVITEGANNRYKWYRGASGYTNSITNSIILPANELPEWYACNITNTVIAGLTLYSRPATNPPTSITDNVYASSKLTIYPNPATDFVSIDYAFECNENINLKIYNSVGQIMFEIQNLMPNGLQNLDLSSMPCGTYHAVFEIGDRRIGQKIIKK